MMNDLSPPQEEFPAVLKREVFINPRIKIRSFLLGTLKFLGVANIDQWPNISEDSYRQLSQRLRTKIEGFYVRSETMESITAEEKTALRLIGESTLNLLWLDWTFADSVHETSSDIFELLKERPYPRLTFDQLYCTPDSTERRINRVLRDVDPHVGRVLF